MAHFFEEGEKDPEVSHTHAFTTVIKAADVWRGDGEDLHVTSHIVHSHIISHPRHRHDIDYGFPYVNERRMI